MRRFCFSVQKPKDSDKTLGFSSGGDDYLAKPFSYSELISRVKALIRRYQVYRGKESDKIVSGKGKASLQYHDLQIKESKREVTSGGKLLELTDIEYEILHLLVKHRGQIFSAERLYESVWNEPYYYGASNTVMVHIRNLRRKIEKDPKNPVLIKNIWGKVYRCD